MSEKQDSGHITCMLEHLQSLEGQESLRRFRERTKRVKMELRKRKRRQIKGSLLHQLNLLGYLIALILRGKA